MSQLLYECIEFLEIVIGDDYEKYNLLMLKLLAEVETDLPDKAVQAVEVAQKYWIEKKATNDDLKEARIKCWQHLDNNKDTINYNTKDYHVLRAAICLLYDSPELTDDMHDSLECFLEELSHILGNDAVLYETVVKIIKEQ